MIEDAHRSPEELSAGYAIALAGGGEFPPDTTVAVAHNVKLFEKLHMLPVPCVMPTIDYSRCFWQSGALSSRAIYLSSHDCITHKFSTPQADDTCVWNCCCWEDKHAFALKSSVCAIIDHSQRSSTTNRMSDLAITTLVQNAAQVLVTTASSAVCSRLGRSAYQVYVTGEILFVVELRVHNDTAPCGECNNSPLKQAATQVSGVFRHD
jgi:hypothetical protein